MDIHTLLQMTIDKRASDLHIIPDYYPTLRVNNELFSVREYGVLTGEMTQSLIYPIMSENQLKILQENKEIDIGVDFNMHRFRCNVYTNKKNVGAAFRLVPNEIKSLEELGLPSLFHTFTTYKQGLILFTGPTGEGKSTSMASIINEINRKQSKHIITIEDPIEFIYPAGRSIISQRELHQDTLSWNIALRSVLREDPDVVLVGEMRDYETIKLVLTIAETGHLVFSTLHTGSSKEAVDRIVGTFPSNEQEEIRNVLASTLVASIAQRLLLDTAGTSRIPCFEILLNTPSVASIIRDGKNFMLDNVMETSEDQGMILFEKYLAGLYKKGLISRDAAIESAIRKKLVEKFI